MRQDSMWVSSVWCSHCIPAREDHPHEVKYCSVATSHFPAHRINCGWPAEQCYLSLCTDHRRSLEAESTAIVLCIFDSVLPSLSRLAKVSNRSPYLWIRRVSMLKAAPLEELPMALRRLQLPFIAGHLTESMMGERAEKTKPSCSTITSVQTITVWNTEVKQPNLQGPF